jgi:hypothetical protein
MAVSILSRRRESNLRLWVVGRGFLIRFRVHLPHYTHSFTPLMNNKGDTHHCSFHQLRIEVGSVPLSWPEKLECTT